MFAAINSCKALPLPGSRSAGQVHRKSRKVHVTACLQTYRTTSAFQFFCVGFHWKSSQVSISRVTRNVASKRIMTRLTFCSQVMPVMYPKRWPKRCRKLTYIVRVEPEARENLGIAASAKKEPIQHSTVQADDGRIRLLLQRDSITIFPSSAQVSIFEIKNGIA